MMRNKAFFGLVSGVVVVVATLIGVALLNGPAESASRGPDSVAAACATLGDGGHDASCSN